MADEQKKMKIQAPKRVLVFSTTLKLIAVCSSIQDAANLLGLTSKAIGITVRKNAADMQMLYACKGFIVRCESAMVELDVEDIGKISLGEYMQLAQERRGRIPVKIMARKINLYTWRQKILDKIDPKKESLARAKYAKAYRKKRRKLLKSRPDIVQMQKKRKNARKPHKCYTIVEDNYKQNGKNYED